ncbi:MAG: YgdI/YgdR family lipoprotein [Akkermansiaceae bacterium]|nr:YgdI/YgdR family lipoprotein [Verrucomicrobiales bacterium]
MKKFIPLLLLGLLMSSGCARRYTIVTNNGSHIPARGKPRLENGAYVYKDYQGRRATVPAGRVREVSPSSMVDKGPSSQFGGSK